MRKTTAYLTIATAATILSTATWPALSQALQPADKNFIMTTAQFGLLEVTLGQMALKSAKYPNVKSFATKILTEQTKANDSLKQLALAKGVTVPTQNDAYGKAVIDMVSKLKGRDFDERYVDLVIGDQVKLIGEIKAESTKGTADLKQWCAQNLPKFEANLKTAKALDREIDSKPQ